jgi:hypothetical protein
LRDEALLLASPRNGVDIGKIAVQGGGSEAETGKTLRSDEKTTIGNIDMDAAIEMAVEEAADGDRGCATSLEITYQEISSLAGREDSFAEENVLTFDVEFGGIEDFLDCDLVIEELVSGGLDELTVDFAGDFTNEVGDEEETIFKDTDAMQDAARIIARYLAAQRGDALMQALFGDEELTITRVLLNHPTLRPLR